MTPGYTQSVGIEHTEAAFHHLEIPLLMPFRTATGSVSSRSVGLVAVSRSGRTGWGEAAPYPGQDEPFADVLDAARTGQMTPTLAAAMNEAMCDLVAYERGVSLSSELGPSFRSVPISVAVGMGDGAIRTVVEAWESGIRRFKIKIMPGRTNHVSNIRGLFPEAVIGIDANGSFDALTIPEILALRDVDVAFVEQPTLNAADPATQTLHDAGFTVFVDESIRSLETAERALAIREVSGVVVKPGRLGWSGSVELVRMARAAGKLWRASGLLETGVGRAFTLVLAAATDAFVSDVAPASRFLSYDIAPQVVEAERLIVPTGPGTGLDVDIDIVRDQAVEVITLSGSAIPNLD
jgi:L-alanine-DL-glutamate epimerase-like enolase superfamily enzyme